MKIAVIIPAFNEEKYIGKTIESVISAKSGDTDIIVVANGCTDATEKIVRGYDITLVSIKEKGISLAKNTGAAKTDAGALLFLDADTRLSKHSLRKIRLALSTYDFGSLWVKPYPSNLKSKLFMTLKNLAFSAMLYKGTNGIIFCKREIFEKTGGFSLHLKKREDKEFIYSASKHGRYTYLKSAHVHTSMRRFERLGYLSVPAYWISVWIKEKTGRNNKEYPAIR